MVSLQHAAVVVALLGGCIFDNEYVGEVPHCEAPVVDMGVQTPLAGLVARLPGNRTAVLGCTTLQYLAADYSVERKATVKTHYPVQVVAAGDGDAMYVLDIEYVPYRGEPEFDEGPGAIYRLLALDGDGAERWRVDLGETYDTYDAMPTIEAVPGGVVMRTQDYVTKATGYDHEGNEDAGFVRHGALDELGGFVSIPQVKPAEKFQTLVGISAFAPNAVVTRWTKMLSASRYGSEFGGTVHVTSVYGLPMGDTVIAGAFYGVSLSLGDLVVPVTGGDPQIPGASFVARIDAGGATTWATLGPQEWFTMETQAVLSADRVVIGSADGFSVVGPTGVSSSVADDEDTRVERLYPSTSGGVAAVVRGLTSAARMFDVQLP